MLTPVTMETWDALWSISWNKKQNQATEERTGIKIFQNKYSVQQKQVVCVEQF